MEANFGRATRTSVFMAVFVAVLMLGLPSFGNGHSVTQGAVDEASAAAGSRTVYIGWVGMRDSVATLSPLLYTMAGEMSVIWPCYSMLTQYDLEGNRIGDLAKSWSVDPDGLTWHFKLYETARFYDRLDPTAVHPVTADDVIFTYYLVQNQTGNYLQSYFPKIDIGGPEKVPMIDYMQKVGTYEFILKTIVPYAPFLSATSSIPILPKYIWEPKLSQTGKYGGWNWPNHDPNLNIPPIVGSGAWYFMEDGITTTGDYRLGKSPTWFATEEYGWTLRNDVIYYKSETSTTSNINDYKAGAVDIMIGVTPAQYLSTQDPLEDYGSKFAQSTGFVYELNINQINESIRDEYGIAPQLGGKDNPILNDPVFRLAVAMSVDKQGFVDDALRGLGSYADSLVPETHADHYWYGVQANETDPFGRPGRAPVGEEPVAFDPVGARLMLMANGWKYRLDGTEIVTGAGDFYTYKPLCKAGATQPLQFRYWTLNTAAEWTSGAMYIANTTGLAGIDLTTLFAAKSVGQMNSAWAQANYDMWLWDWFFSPTSEVSTDVMQVLASEAIGSWSDVYVSDPAYDEVYYASLQAVDPGARQLLTDELQRMSYERYDCQAVAYRKELYAAGPSTASADSDHWTNYGDWEENYLLMPDMLAPYLFMRIQPRDQPAPQIISVQDSVTVEKETPLSLLATASDPANGVEFRWFWGDGAKDPGYVYESDGQSTGTHTYLQDGYYTAWLAVRENTGVDKFVNVTKISVTVTDSSNYAPTFSVGADYSPKSPAPDQGTTVSLAATATDVNLGDTLEYWWVTNDGHTLFGQNVTYQFRDMTKTLATCYVDDKHVGTGARPVTSQVLVPVGPNYAPTVSAKYVSPVAVGYPYQFNVTADDANAPDKTRWRFTWNWGDGSESVTSDPTASHTYAFKKTYTYTVWCDDMSQLPSHNVSSTNQIRVASPSNVAPEVNAGTFMVSPLSVVQGESIDMQVDVRDWDQDPLYVDFEIYDSGANLYDVEEVITPSKKTAWTTVPASYLFDVEFPVGTYTIYANISDGQDLIYAAETYDVTVSLGNKPPTVGLLPPLNLTKASAHIFTVSASDINGDPLTYWWDFGDGNYSALATPSKAYATAQASQPFSVSVDDGTGLAGHNVTRTGYAIVNAKPAGPLYPQGGLGGAESTFSILATDEDDLMNLVYTWSWGDGSPTTTVAGIPEATHTYPVPAGAVQNYTATLYLNDMYVDMDGVSHNISVTAMITVGQAQFNMTISAGWNFIVVPLLGAGYKASMLELEKNDIVAQWNPATKSYDKTYIVGVSPGALDFTLALNSGYWVFADSDETLTWVGAAPSGTMIRAVTTPAGGGWVNIGLHTLNATWKASKIPTIWSGSNVSLVAMYNPATKTYKTYIKGVPPSDYTLVPGWAVWVLVTGSGTLTYTP